MLRKKIGFSMLSHFELIDSISDKRFVYFKKIAMPKKDKLSIVPNKFFSKFQFNESVCFPQRCLKKPLLSEYGQINLGNTCFITSINELMKRLLQISGFNPECSYQKDTVQAFAKAYYFDASSGEEKNDVLKIFRSVLIENNLIEIGYNLGTIIHKLSANKILTQEGSNHLTNYIAGKAGEYQFPDWDVVNPDFYSQPLHKQSKQIFDKGVLKNDDNLYIFFKNLQSVHIYDKEKFNKIILFLKMSQNKDLSFVDQLIIMAENFLDDINDGVKQNDCSYYLRELIKKLSEDLPLKNDHFKTKQFKLAHKATFIDFNIPQYESDYLMEIYIGSVLNRPLGIDGEYFGYEFSYDDVFFHINRDLQEPQKSFDSILIDSSQHIHLVFPTYEFKFGSVFLFEHLFHIREIVLRIGENQAAGHFTKLICSNFDEMLNQQNGEIILPQWIYVDDDEAVNIQITELDMAFIRKHVFMISGKKLR